MPSSRTQRVRHHTVEVPVDNWGQRQTHPHNLNDGNSSGYTPNIVYVTGAAVVFKDRKYAINQKIVAIVKVDAVDISFIVGDAPSGQMLKDVLTLHGESPSAITFDVLTRCVYSNELGTDAVADETLVDPPTTGLVPFELLQKPTVK
jgi:hypothetical protein